MDSARKKELKNIYRNSAVTGGICCIRCSGNQRVLIQATRNIESLRNRFDFAMSMKSCPDPSLRGEWLKYGAESFSFDVLEELKKGKNQTDKEFLDDIDVLYEIWQEKSQQGNL